MSRVDLVQKNSLLGYLTQEDINNLIPYIEKCEYSPEKDLYRPNEPITHLHFPVTAVFSLEHEFENGNAAEVAVIGTEGFIGGAILLGHYVSPETVKVKIAGSGYRIGVRVIQEKLEVNKQLKLILLKYMQALFTQVTQIAACNRHHSIEQQFCRSILASSDCLKNDQMRITHETISRSMGVRRESITQAAKYMKDLDYVHYSRGLITIINRLGLEQRACECYGIIKSRYSRIMNDYENVKRS